MTTETKVETRENGPAAPQESKNRRTAERRRVLKLLVAAGALGPLSAEALQARTDVTDEALKHAQELLDRDFTDERLRELVPSIQRNLDFFQIVRDLEIDDLVEPPTIFRARGK